MDTFEIVLLLVVLGGFAGIVWFLQKSSASSSDKNQNDELKRLIEESARIKAELDQKREEMGKIQSELDKEKSERSELQGKNKQMFVENESLKSDVKNLQIHFDEAKKKISEFEVEKARMEKEHEKKMNEAENMRKSWEDEKTRIRREDEEEQQRILEEQNRIWNDHENTVIARLKEICQNPQFDFQFFDNTNLPDDFDGGLKPDFLVKFLDQYIIFDAKKSKDMSTYLNDQVKKTVPKIKKSSSVNDIYSSVFFVIPTEEFINVRKTFFYEDGYSFFIVSVESLEAILAAYKKITEYEKISDFDPQDRENIVNLLAHYDRHISFQNAANILLAEEGVNVMNSKESLPEEMQNEIDLKKQSMRAFKLKESELKKLSQSTETQKKSVEKMVSPKKMIDEKDLESVQESLL